MRQDRSLLFLLGVILALCLDGRPRRGQAQGVLLLVFPLDNSDRRLASLSDLAGRTEDGSFLVFRVRVRDLGCAACKVESYLATKSIVKISRLRRGPTFDQVLDGNLGSVVRKLAERGVLYICETAASSAKGKVDAELNT
jgi:hypothetical protein